MPEQTIREWLEETADRLMRDRSAEISRPVGVQELRYAMETETHPDRGYGHEISVPGPRTITFIAVLDNGAEIATTRR